MTQLTTFENELARKNLALHEFIRAYCSTWPAAYLPLLPLTFDGRILQQSKAAIEQQIEKDFSAYLKEKESPWRYVGTMPSSIDWSGLTVAVGAERGVGMPSLVKLGTDADGKPYNDYPEVVEARKLAPFTAENIASVLLEELQRRLQNAAARHANAVNNEQPFKTCHKLQARMDELSAAYKIQQKKYDRLRADPVKSCKLEKTPGDYELIEELREMADKLWGKDTE